MSRAPRAPSPGALVPGALAALALLLGLGVAQAQDQEDVVVDENQEGGEVRQPMASTSRFLDDPLETVIQRRLRPDVGVPYLGVVTATEIHAYDNRDYQRLDESTDQRVIDTDDRRNFGHTDIVATLAYRPQKAIQLDTQLKYDLVWRDDGLGRTRARAGMFNVFRLSASYSFYESKDFSLRTTVGRQPFRIGGVPRDYMLDGTVDAVTLNAGFGAFGRLRILAVDFFAGHDQPLSGYQFFRDGSETVFGLRGETNTLRTGGIYELNPRFKGGDSLDLKAYYFYASVGGGPIDESGANITYGGTLGNFRDRDYQHLMGARGAYKIALGDDGSHLNLYGEFARSAGIDRRPVVERDVDTSGNAFGGGAELTVRGGKHATFYLAGDFYHFDGSRYGSDGLDFERGFVGFRGARLGGLTLARQSAWRPSAHLDAFGIDHTPQDISRSAGTQFLHASAGTRLGATSLRFDFWTFTDTAQTFLDVANLDAIDDPPFGRSRAEFAAQARVGQHLGYEYNLEVAHRFGEETEDSSFRIYTNFGAFVPGEYYNIKVDRVAGRRLTALGGDATFWALRFGTMVSF